MVHASRAKDVPMSVRPRLVWAVAAVNLLIVAVVAAWLLHQPASSSPEPAQPAATPTVDDSWYRSLPDSATMPACPPNLPRELIRYFYRNCP
jgi:hypothetical protein